jgi:hypothetical protein
VARLQVWIAVAINLLLLEIRIDERSRHGDLTLGVGIGLLAGLGGAAGDGV